MIIIIILIININNFKSTKSSYTVPVTGILMNCEGYKKARTKRIYMKTDYFKRILIFPRLYFKEHAWYKILKCTASFSLHMP